MADRRLTIDLQPPGATAAADPFADPGFYDGILGRRFLAFLVDLLVLSVLYIVAWVTAGVLGFVTLGVLSPVLGIVLALVPVAYFTWFQAQPRPQTPGMRLFAIEVRRMDGGRPDYLQTFIRTVLFGFTAPNTAFAVMLVCLLNDRRRAVHDYLSGTLVVNAKPVMVMGGAAAGR